MLDFGIPLYIGYVLLPLMFIMLSHQLFVHSAFAIYVYALVALVFVSTLNAPQRNTFLKSIYRIDKYKQIRVLENICYCLPFTLFLIYKSLFLFAALLNGCAILLVYFNVQSKVNYTLPTPFSKKPYEYTVGFRKTIFVFPLAYLLTCISVSVGNFNLGIFSIFLMGCTCLS